MKRIPTELAKRVGKNLRAARLALNITQQKIAAEMNKHYTQISDYETGKLQLDYEKIVFLCNRLDITPNDLFDIDYSDVAIAQRKRDNPKQ